MKIKKEIIIKDAGFIFNQATGESFSLNPFALEIIRKLKEGKNCAEIKQEILDKYHTDELIFERDYYDFLYMINHYQLTDKDE